MLREKNQETNMSSYNKWQVFNSFTLCPILNLSARAPLWKIACKKLNGFSMKNEDYWFQVGCVSYFNFKKTRHSRSKLISVFFVNFII